MMRFNLIIAVLLTLATQLSGQVEFGVKAFYGVNYGAEITQEFVNLQPLQVYTISTGQATARKGLGLSVLASNDKLFVMNDVQYVRSGSNFALQSVNYARTLLDPEVAYTTNQSSLRLTTTAGVNLGKLKLGVGPEFSYNLSNTETLSEIDGIDARNKSFNKGFNFLIGYQLMDKLHLDLKHTYMLQDVSNNYTFHGIPMEMQSNPKYLELSLGMYF